MRKLFALAGTIGVVAVLLSSATPANAGSGCPSLTSGPNDAQILYTYTWSNNGCPMPIRKGFYTATGFGWDHINYRRVVDGLVNHETTSFARTLWAQALAGPGYPKTNGLICHQKKYYTSPGNNPRTMMVLISTTNYASRYGYKGINTAYWVSGHTNSCG